MTALVLFLLLFAAYRMGAKLEKKKPPDIQLPKLTDDEAELRAQAEKAKQIQAHFQRLMNYDVDKALERTYEVGE